MEPITLVCAAVALVVAVGAVQNACGQSEVAGADSSEVVNTNPLPADLQAVPEGVDVSGAANWYSFSTWGTWPPMPFNWVAAKYPDVTLPLYWSPSMSTNALFVFIDDTGLASPGAQAMAGGFGGMADEVGASTNGLSLMPPPDDGSGTNDLSTNCLAAPAVVSLYAGTNAF